VKTTVTSLKLQRNAGIIVMLLIVLETARPFAAPVVENLFLNSSFEDVGLGGDEWRLSRGGDTEAEFTVDRQDAAEGERSACIRIGRVSEWGSQFGQRVAAGKQGQTYTFAVLTKGAQQPVTVNLQIERRASPYDGVAKGGPFTLAPGRWTELHTTFTVEKEFPQGWFAYISCAQSNCEYRADAFRLYEGEYAAFEKPAREDEASGDVRLTQTAGEEVSVGNNYVTLTVRKGAGGAVVFYRLGEQTVKGPLLVPALGADAGGRTRMIDGFRVLENHSSKVLLEVRSVSADGKGIVTRYLLRKNQPIIEAQAGDGMDRLFVETRSRYAVVPDIFAGDLVVNPPAVSQTQLRLPSENVLAQLVDDGNAIVAGAWRSNTQVVRLTLNGAGENRVITATEIGCRKDFPVAVAVLAGPGIWHRKKIAELDPVKDVKLDWSVPFRALWRADYRREDGLIDSWKVLVRKSGSDWEDFGVRFEEPKTRTVWTSARGMFAYPACIDGNSAFLRRTRFEEQGVVTYRGDDCVVVYPLRKISGAPATARGVLDVLREALAGAPEEKLLDELVIKPVPRDHYPATCGVTAQNEAIFDDGEERAKKQFMLARLDAMNHFVVGIRSRIDEYRTWRKATGEFVAAQKAAQPQLAALADEFEGVLVRFDKRYDDFKLAERTPAVVKTLTARVIALIDSNESNKVDEVKQIGRDTRTIGGSQDHTLGDFRMIMRELRQRAGYRMGEATDEAAFEFARAVRERTLEVLHYEFGMEGAFNE